MLREGFRDGVTRRLLSGGGSAFVAKVAGAGMAFAAQVVAARLLGPTPYGQFAYTLALLNFVAVFSIGGYGTASVRFISAMAGRAKPDQLREFVGHSSRRTMDYSLLLSGIGVAILWVLRDSMAPPLFRSLLLGCLALPIATQVNLWSSYLQGSTRMIASIVPRSPGKYLVFIGILWLASVTWGVPLDSPIAVGAYFVSLVLMVLVLIGLFQASIGRGPRVSTPRRTTLGWDRVALTLLLIDAIYIVLGQTDMLLLGLLNTTTAAGFYSAARNISTLVIFGLGAMNAIAAPVFSDLHANGTRADLQRAASTTVLATVVFTVPAAVVAVIAGPRLLGLFGPAFLVAYPALVILVIGALVNALSGSVGVLLIMSGRERIPALYAGVAAIVNIVLNLLLIPRYGLEGSAIATAISMVLWNVALVVKARLEIGVDGSILSLLRTADGAAN